MADYFALCVVGEAQSIKRITLTQDVQAQVDALFDQQEVAFLDGIDEEVEFDGDWKPDDDQILVCDITDSAQAVQDAINGNALALPELDAANFMNEGVKAILSGRGAVGAKRVLIQRFSAQQILSNKFALLLDRNMFKRLEQPSFSLNTSLVAIIDGGQIKFKSYHMVRSIFDLSDYYQEATNEDIDRFSRHAALHIADIAAFKELADQTVRKLVHAIEKNGVLDAHTAEQVQVRASAVNLNIILIGGKVQMPAEKADIKRLLQFLHDDIYKAPLSENYYVTNSKRLA